MAENVYFINPAWIESAKQDLDDEDMREYYYWLIECRVCGRDLNECSNKLIKIALRDILRQADTIQENYENSVKEGKKGGRKPNPNTEAIYKMAKEGKKGIVTVFDVPLKYLSSHSPEDLIKTLL
jgi:hypothetical protein